MGGGRKAAGSLDPSLVPNLRPCLYDANIGGSCTKKRQKRLKMGRAKIHKFTKESGPNLNLRRRGTTGRYGMPSIAPKKTHISTQNWVQRFVTVVDFSCNVDVLGAAPRSRVSGPPPNRRHGSTPPPPRGGREGKTCVPKKLTLAHCTKIQK